MKAIVSFYADALKIALQSIFAHKLRAFLTLIGIIIGVSSVVVVGASINGLNSYVLNRVGKILGANHFMIARMAHEGEISEEERERMNRRNKRLEWDDFEWVREHCGSCAEVGAQLESSIDLKHEGKEMYRTRLSGVTANMVDIEDKTIGEGRFITSEEVGRAEPVVVIGMDVREKFFPTVDPIDKIIRIHEMPMRIVGVEAKRGSAFGQTLDNIAYIPITTYRLIFGPRQGLQIHGKAGSRDTFQSAIEDARTAMRIKHKLKGNEDDDFGLVNVGDLNKDIDSFFASIAVVVLPITVISLVVGGIVVMNIMLVSVTERTFEIGLRKAVGATRRQILMQFLIESSLLCAFGGVLGLFLAQGISWLVTVTTPMPMDITIAYMILAVLFAGGIGMIAGMYPAFKAARLDPIIALTRT
jgi:putative ABC transport system permease protein